MNANDSPSPTSEKIIIGKNRSLLDAIRQLEACKAIGAIIVVENDEDNPPKVVGMLSDGDVRRWLIRYSGEYKNSIMDVSVETIITTLGTIVQREMEGMNQDKKTGITTVLESDSWFSKIEYARNTHKKNKGKDNDDERRIRIVPIVNNHDDNHLIGVLDLVATKDRTRLDATLMQMAYPVHKRAKSNLNWLTVDSIKKRREDYDACHIDAQIKKYEALAKLKDQEILAMLHKYRIDLLYMAFKRASDWAKDFISPDKKLRKRLDKLKDNLAERQIFLLKKYRETYLNRQLNQSFLGSTDKPINILCILGSFDPKEREARVQLATEILKKLESMPKVILSGGGKDGSMTEAQAMKKIIMEKAKIKSLKENLILEEDSLDTVGNAVFSTLLLLEKNFLVLDDNKKVVGKGGGEIHIGIVTSGYHAPRAFNLFAQIFKPENVRVWMANYPNDGFDSDSKTISGLDSEFKANSQTFALENVITGLPDNIDHGEVFSVFFQLLRKHDLYKNRTDLVRKYKKIIKKWIAKRRNNVPSSL